MREVDRIMVEEHHIQLIQMMELAGKHLARFCLRQYLNHHTSANPLVVILAGTGGNGGGALAAARHLSNNGISCSVLLSKASENYSSIPGKQLNILKHLNPPMHHWNHSGPGLKQDLAPDLIIDGLIGYSLHGDPYGTIATMIDWANQQHCPVVSLDVPTGFDATDGTGYSPCIKADSTLTLALPKTGFQRKHARRFTGKIYLADIGVPPEVYSKSSLNTTVAHLFRYQDIIPLD